MINMKAVIMNATEKKTEITPELAARLGASIASLGLVNIIVATSGSTASDMLKSAIMAGVQSIGVVVVDLGETSLDEFLFAMCFLDSKIGAYISGTSETSIEIFGENGLPLTTDIEKALEEIFLQGEISRANPLLTGERVIIPEIKGFYLKNMDEKKYS